MMADTQTQAATPVEAPSIEDRMSEIFARDQARAQHKAMPVKPQPASEPEQPPPAVEDAQDQVADNPSEEIADDAIDLEVEAPSEADDYFEIVHNGRQQRLSREETIRFAQQGFDYTQKTQALAERQRGLDEMLRQASEIEQLTPHIAQEYAKVMDLGERVRQWDQVDFVRVARENPVEYPALQAQADAERRAYDTAMRSLSAKTAQVREARGRISGQQLALEKERLTAEIPAWRNEKTFAAEAPQLREYLVKRGFPPQAVDSENNGLVLALAYESMQYRKLLAQRDSKLKQVRSAPPMGRPGAAQSPTSAAVRQAKDLRANLRKSGDVQDAAKLFAAIERSKKR